MAGVKLEDFITSFPFMKCALYIARGAPATSKSIILFDNISSFEVYPKLTYQQKAQVCVSKCTDTYIGHINRLLSTVCTIIIFSQPTEQSMQKLPITGLAI